MCSTVQEPPGVTRIGPARTSARPVWQLSDTEVETALVELEAGEALLVARRSELVREADQRSLKDRSQALSTERWLRDRFRLSCREAKNRITQAELLLGQPGVHDALAAGRLTAEQAIVIATALVRVDQLEGLDPVEREQAAALLVEQAAGLDPRDLATAAQHLLEHLTRTPSVDDPADAEQVARDQAAAEAAAKTADTNTLFVKRRADGTLAGRFTIRPADVPIVNGWLKRADVPHPGTDGFEDDRTCEQRRGDHLVRSLRDALTHSDSDSDNDEPAATKVRVHVNVTTSLDALRDGLAGTGLLDTGGTLSASELRRLACGAGITPIVLGGPSEVLDLGRTRRGFSLPQRRAITARDRGCATPGCTRPPGDCDVHHQDEWSRSGPTDLDNGVLACEFHHQKIHREGWTVRLAPNGYPELVPPVSIDPEQRPRQHHRYRLTLLTTRRRT